VNIVIIHFACIIIPFFNCNQRKSGKATLFKTIGEPICACGSTFTHIHSASSFIIQYFILSQTYIYPFFLLFEYSLLNSSTHSHIHLHLSSLDKFVLVVWFCHHVFHWISHKLHRCCTQVPICGAASGPFDEQRGDGDDEEETESANQESRCAVHNHFHLVCLNVLVFRVVVIVLSALPALGASAFGTFGAMMVVVVVMMVGWRRTMMVVVMVVVRGYSSSPFAVIGPPLIALAPGASAFCRRPVGIAVSGITLAVFRSDSEIAAFAVMSGRVGGSEFAGARGLGFALGRSIFPAVAPGAAAFPRGAMGPEAAFVPTAFAFVRGDAVFPAVGSCWLGRRWFDGLGCRRYFGNLLRWPNRLWRLEIAMRLRAILPKVPTKLRAFIPAIAPRASAVSVGSVLRIT